MVWVRICFLLALEETFLLGFHFCKKSKMKFHFGSLLHLSGSLITKKSNIQTCLLLQNQWAPVERKEATKITALRKLTEYLLRCYYVPISM